MIRDNGDQVPWDADQWKSVSGTLASQDHIVSSGDMAIALGWLISDHFNNLVPALRQVVGDNMERHDGSRSPTYARAFLATASKANNAVQAVIAVTTLVVTVTTWWRFGTAWGLCALFACLLLIAVVTGVRLQGQLSAFSDIHHACHLTDLLIKRRVNISDMDKCVALEFNLVFKNMGAVAIEYAMLFMKIVVGEPLSDPTAGNPRPKAWYVIHPSHSDTFVVVMPLADPVIGDTTGTIEYTLRYRPLHATVEFEQHATLRFENSPTIGGGHATSYARQGEFYDRSAATVCP